MKPSQTPRVDALVQVIDGGSEYAPLPDLLRLARNLERELDCAQENFRVTNKAYCDQNRELRELQARTIPPEAGSLKEALEVVFSNMDANGDPVGAQPENSWERGYCAGLRYAYRVLKQRGIPLPSSEPQRDGS